MSLNYKAKLEAYLKVEEHFKKEPDENFRNYILNFLKAEKDQENFKVERQANGERDVVIPDSFKMINIAKMVKEEDERLSKIDQKDANNMKVSLNFRNAVKDYSV